MIATSAGACSTRLAFEADFSLRFSPWAKRKILRRGTLDSAALPKFLAGVYGEN